MNEPPNTHPAPYHSDKKPLIEQRTNILRLTQWPKVPSEGKMFIVSVASSSAVKPQLISPIDTIKEALDTCHYLLAQSWVAYYPASKMRPYVDLGLHAAALQTCKSLLEMNIHNVLQDYQDSLIHGTFDGQSCQQWSDYLWWLDA